MDDEELSEWSNVLGCRVGNWPLRYLGLKVGWRLNGLEAWKDSLDRVRGRLKR